MNREFTFTSEVLEDIVSLILICDGPDGHCDGSGIIRDFILALLEGRGVEWVRKYYEERCPEKGKGGWLAEGVLEEILNNHGEVE